MIRRSATPSLLTRELPLVLALLLLLLLIAVSLPLRLPGEVRSWSQASTAAHAVGEPRQLRIDRLGLDAPLLSLGLLPSREMEVPRQSGDVGWYAFGARPGEPGNAVITGHRDGEGGVRGVFWDLRKLEPGDVVEVEDDAGGVHRFRVLRQVQYAAGEAPMEEIFGAADKPRLNLITCDGTWSWQKLEYEKRLVVFTEMI